MKATIGAVAADNPAKHADPKPLVGSCTTRAPPASAISADPSVEPLSTTIAR